MILWCEDTLPSKNEMVVLYPDIHRLQWGRPVDYAVIGPSCGCHGDGHRHGDG